MIESPFTATSADGWRAVFGLLALDEPAEVARIIYEGIERSRNRDPQQYGRWSEIAGCFNAMVLAGGTAH